jgi:cephalosporin-C deacetylase-like acetyl esterase
MKKMTMKTKLLTTGVAVAALAAGWYAVFGLKPYSVTAADITERYAYAKPSALNFELKQDDSKGYHFSYTSFDGAIVNGYMRLPAGVEHGAEPLPVLIGAHGMGRSVVRWWQDSFKDKPTVEHTDKVASMALSKGYAVVTIDARNHGKRKDPDNGIIAVMRNLRLWGENEPYEQMLIDTVRDHRVLLDWLNSQAQFDATRIDVAGYSMGAQVSLLLASVDDRVRRVAAFVPPHASNRTAIVAPLNALQGLADNPVLLITANDDKYASSKENMQLFNALPNADKQHYTFDSGHYLPGDYVQRVEQWL